MRVKVYRGEGGEFHFVVEDAEDSDFPSWEFMGYGRIPLFTAGGDSMDL